MSYVSFLGKGPQGQQQMFRRDFFKPDTVSSIATTHTFNGEVTSISNILNNDPLKSEKEVIIDSAIKVNTVADKIRAQAQQLWSNLRNGCMGTFTATLIGGIAAAIASIAIGVILPPMWPVAVAVGILALGLLGVSAWNLARGVEAKHQLKQWEDPIPAYQNQRRMAEQKGFYHAYSSGYKGRIVSEKELEKLWFTSMDQWADNYEAHIANLNQVKVQDIRTFMEECPLKSQAMAHTFGKESDVEDGELEFLNELSGKYSSLKSQYDTIRMETEALKSQIRKEKSNALLQNDHELACNIAPYRALISAQKMDLKKQRNKYKRIISTYETTVHHHRTYVNQPARSHHRHHATRRSRTHFKHNHERVANARRYGMPGPVTTVVTTTPTHHVVPHTVKSARAEVFALNAKLARLDAIYHVMTAPACHLHATNKAKIEHLASVELNKIKASEDKTFMKFYQPIKVLLDAYKHRNDEEKFEEVEVDTEVDFAVNPNAPELRKDFEIPEYDEKWSEFIGEVDWENGIIKKTTIEHDGNKTTTTTNYKY